MRRVVLLTLSALVILGIGFGAVYGVWRYVEGRSAELPRVEPMPAAPAPVAEVQDEDDFCHLVLLDRAWAEREPAIVGTVWNPCKRTRRMVRVEFELLDAAGRIVERPSAYLGDLGAGERWRFEAIYLTQAPGLTARLRKLEGDPKR